MKKWANELNGALQVQMAKKTHEKMFTSPSHTENVNFLIKIPPHCWYNSYHQELKQQMLVRIKGKKNPHTLLLGM
jgi:hypothetical protein